MLEFHKTYGDIVLLELPENQYVYSIASPESIQHVLPKGFVKVRYYGFFAPSLQARLACLHEQLSRLHPDEPSIGGEPQAGVQHMDSVLYLPCGQVMQKQIIIPPH